MVTLRCDLYKESSGFSGNACTPKEVTLLAHLWSSILCLGNKL